LSFLNLTSLWLSFLIHRLREDNRDREAEVLARVRAIPPGSVATYGDVSPGAPRFAGTVLFGATEPDLPWWRVVRADGSLAKGARQKRRLREEGVPFRGDRVEMGAARVGELRLRR
jgi:alkylated DNA nucleotide flippase Atl1